MQSTQAKKTDNRCWNSPGCSFKITWAREQMSIFNGVIAVAKSQFCKKSQCWKHNELLRNNKFFENFLRTKKNWPNVCLRFFLLASILWPKTKKSLLCGKNTAVSDSLFGHLQLHTKVLCFGKLLNVIKLKFLF